MARRAARRGRPLRWNRRHAAPQELHCRHRQACLDEAVRRGFPGFSCMGCADAELTPLADVAQEHAGLLALAAVVLDPQRRCVGDHLRGPTRCVRNRSIAGALAELAGRRP
jgi:hypothetical protein